MWSDTSPNFSLNVCRLCANISDVVIPIFGKDGEKDRLDLKIKKCLPITVREEDFKPKQVCFNCASKLEVCVDLVDMCLASEFKFDSVLQSRYPGLKTVDAGQNTIEQQEETKETQMGEQTLGVVPLIQQTSKQTEITPSNTLTVSHEGGVIVLSKVDTDLNNQQREECQDILLMVELKYNKDLPDSQQATIAKAHTITYTVEPQDGSLTKLGSQPFAIETNKTHALSFPASVQTDSKAPTLAYTVEQPPIDGAKTYTLAYSADPQDPVVAKTSAITYTSEPQPIVVSKSFTYSSDQDNSLGNKTQLTYSPEPNNVDSDKSHTIVFTDAQPIALTKDPLTFSTENTQPVALIKSNVLTYGPDRENESGKDEVFITDRPEHNCHKRQDLTNVGDCLQVEDKSTKILNFADPEIVLDENVTQETLLLVPPVDAENQFKENSSEVTSSSKREKPFPCNVCGKSFMRRTNLNVHMAVHTQIRPHQCDQCGKRFVLKWDLTLHQRIHTGLFSCEYCSKAFSVRGKLERHRRTHTGERPYPCPTCGKAFGDKRNLESHVRTHSGERPFVCVICNRSFRVRSHLTDHRRVHSQDTPYTCDTCGKSFKWKTNLNIHLKVHSGERFPCEECGREFGRRADLIKHQRSHTGDRPHACGICTKSYSDKAMLQKHLKSHSDHKPYSCDVCGKSFHFHWYLNTHKKIHCEDKSFPCQLCGKVFNKRGNLVYHMKAMHHAQEQKSQPQAQPHNPQQQEEQQQLPQEEEECQPDEQECSAQL